MLNEHSIEQVRAAVPVQLMAQFGLEWASESNFPYLLGYQRLEGIGTAFRDSFIMGALMLMNLKGVFNEETFKWKMVHILITDGEDVSSKNSIHQACEVQLALSLKIPLGHLKQFFILVDGKQGQQHQLKKIASAGGLSSEFISVQSTQIQEVFDRLTIQLGIKHVLVTMESEQKIQTRSRAATQIQQDSLIVLFNIDVSPSMNRLAKFSHHIKGISNFIQLLSPTDLVCGLVFDSTVRVLTKTQTLETEYLDKPLKHAQRYPKKSKMKYTTSTVVQKYTPQKLDNKQLNKIVIHQEHINGKHQTKKGSTFQLPYFNWQIICRKCVWFLLIVMFLVAIIWGTDYATTQSQ